MPPFVERRRSRKPKQLELFGRKVEAAQWRAAILKRLLEEGEHEMAGRLAKCGQPMSLWCAECGHEHPCETKCTRKWCPSCAPKRGNERADRLRVLIGSMQWPMHLTFTVPNIAYGHSSRSMMRDLMLAFRRLRRLKLWKENVEGGAYGMEVTDKGEGYHPHLHVVIDCQWLSLHTPAPHWRDSAARKEEKQAASMAEVQAAWQFATGIDNHMSIYARRCDSNAASEILKYALKSEDALKLQGKLGDVFRAMDAVRMCQAFGSIRGVKIPEDEEHKLLCPNGHAEWRTVRTIGRVEEALRWNERREHQRALNRRREVEAFAMTAAIARINAEWDTLRATRQTPAGAIAADVGF